MEKIPIDPISLIINPSNRGRNLEYFILDEKCLAKFIGTIPPYDF